MNKDQSTRRNRNPHVQDVIGVKVVQSSRQKIYEGGQDADVAVIKEGGPGQVEPIEFSKERRAQELVHDPNIIAGRHIATGHCQDPNNSHHWQYRTQRDT